MIPNLDPRQMKRMMQQMGIQSEEINDAERVVIERGNSKIIIQKPQIVVLDMQGQKSFQIVGTVSEEESISEDDIQLVAEQAKVSKELAKKALKETNGDIAQAILNLQKK